jgi:hypothetical protein
VRDFEQRDDFGDFEANLEFLKSCGVLTPGRHTLDWQRQRPDAP